MIYSKSTCISIHQCLAIASVEDMGSLWILVQIRRTTVSAPCGWRHTAWGLIRWDWFALVKPWNGEESLMMFWTKQNIIIVQFTRQMQYWKIQCTVKLWNTEHGQSHVRWSYVGHQTFLTWLFHLLGTLRLVQDVLHSLVDGRTKPAQNSKTYSGPPSSRGNLFRAPQWMSGTAEST